MLDEPALSLVAGDAERGPHAGPQAKAGDGGQNNCMPRNPRRRGPPWGAAQRQDPQPDL